MTVLTASSFISVPFNRTRVYINLQIRDIPNYYIINLAHHEILIICMPRADGLMKNVHHVGVISEMLIILMLSMRSRVYTTIIYVVTNRATSLILCYFVEQ